MAREENKEKEEEEDEEDEIDVVGIKLQTYSQVDENFVVHSTKQTTDEDANMAKDGVILSPALLIDQEEALSIVRCVLETVIDAVCKMDHCNSDRTTTGETLACVYMKPATNWLDSQKKPQVKNDW